MTNAEIQASPGDIRSYPVHEEIARRAQELYLMTKAQSEASRADIQNSSTHEEIARHAQELYLMTKAQSEAGRADIQRCSTYEEIARCAQELYLMMKAQTEPNPADIGRYPTHEEIAQRAQEVYLRRGAKAGSDQEDWLQAERELIEEPKWLEEMTNAQKAHAVYWEHPWSVEVNPSEDEEAFAAFEASLGACNAEKSRNRLDAPVSAGSEALIEG